jgi:hypothetical protein
VPSSSITRERKRPSAASEDLPRGGRAEEDAPFADDEIDDVSDDEAADDETAMRRAMRRSPRYPALLDAYFECATVGASATRVAAAERRKRKLLERAARARADGIGDRPIGHAFESDPILGGGDHPSGSGSGSSSSSSSKCSRWRAGEIGEPGPTAQAFPLDPFRGPVFERNGPRAARADARSVDEFMAKCVSEMEAYAEDLRATYREAEDACAAFEARVAKLGRLTLRDDDEEKNARATRFPVAGAAPAPAPAPATRPRSEKCPLPLGPSARGAHSSDTLRETLKRKYAASILTLKDEFLKKRKKGKLPSAATDFLKTWWREKVVWPYPTEEEKRCLGSQTGLDPTQINNWFINQRKRHWHKLFENGVPPNDEHEARAALAKRFGSIQAAVDVARDA